MHRDDIDGLLDAAAEKWEQALIAKRTQHLKDTLLEEERVVEEEMYVTVLIGDERWALPIADVSEILPRPKVTPFPGDKPCLVGVMNLRGELLAVIDLARYLGIHEMGIDDYVVVVQMSGVRMALLIDSITNISGVSRDSVKAAISSADGEASGMVLGEILVEGHVVSILDTQRLLATVI